MTTIRLQDMRKKATKAAYAQEVLDCCPSVVTEFSEYNNLPLPDLNSVAEVSTFMLTHVFEGEWLIEKGLVSSDLIPANKDLTMRMQEAAERHFEYCARTLLDNIDHATFAKLV